MGKTAIWTILCFYLPPPLNNVEKQRAKLASSYVMGWKHCIVGEGDFKHSFKNSHYILSLIVGDMYKTSIVCFVTETKHKVILKNLAF